METATLVFAAILSGNGNPDSAFSGIPSPSPVPVVARIEAIGDSTPETPTISPVQSTGAHQIPPGFVPSDTPGYYVRVPTLPVYNPVVGYPIQQGQRTNSGVYGNSVNFPVARQQGELSGYHPHPTNMNANIAGSVSDMGQTIPTTKTMYAPIVTNPNLIQDWFSLGGSGLQGGCLTGG